MLRTYNPKDIILIVGGHIVSGFGDSIVQVSRNADSFSRVSGAHGEGTRTKMLDKSGRVVVTLQQTSESNAIFGGYLQLQDTEQSNNDTFNVLIKNVSGADLYSAEVAWFIKHADASFAKEASDRVYTIETNELLMFSGGSPSLGA